MHTACVLNQAFLGGGWVQMKRKLKESVASQQRASPRQQQQQQEQQQQQQEAPGKPMSQPRSPAPSGQPLTSGASASSKGRSPAAFTRNPR